MTIDDLKDEGEAADVAASTEDEEEQSFDEAFAEMTGAEVEDEQEDVPKEDEPAEEAGDSVDDDDSKIESDDSTDEEESELDKLRRENQELEHKFRSNDGRIAAYQRQIAQYQDQSPAQAGDENEDGDDQDAADPDLETFRTEYPEIAGPLEKMREQDKKRIEQLESRLAAQGEHQRQDQLDHQEQVLQDAHSDWVDVTANPEFSAWVQKQPLYVQEAASRNGQQITDGQEAADLIDRFKSTQTQNEPSDEPSPDEPKPNAGKRKRQLESSATVANKGPGAASGPGNDYDSAFAYYANKKK